jgi:predicted permease
VAPDLSVLLFTFGACLLTALIAGLYPAWQASRIEANSGLKGSAFLLGLHRSQVRRGLIVAQIMLTVVLLFGASLFAHSLGKLRTISLGYDIDHLLTVEIGRRGPYKKEQTDTRPAMLDVLDRVRTLPGVEDAALSNPGVLTGGTFLGQVTAQDASGAALPHADAYFLSAGTHYFSTMRIPVLRGRDFTEADRRARPPVALINQRFAAQFWPGQDPLGKHFNGQEVIGVVGNSKYSDVREETRLIGYFSDPLRQGALSLEIRCRGGFSPVERQVRDLVKSMAPGYQVSRVASMELLRDTVMAQDRLLTFLSTLFGILGVALALVGIYGLISYSVTRRTREVGIRMSLGAQPADVLWLFLREILLLIAAGMLLGLPLALGLARFLVKMLYRVSPSDPLGIAATLLLLTLGGLAAAWLPGRRATRVDPVQALRYD